MGKNKLLIIGASGHGKVVADIALRMNKWKSISFLDDDSNLKKTMDIDIIGTTKNIHKYLGNYEFIIGIGNNQIRQRFFEILKEAGAIIPSLIHPNAIVGNKVEIGAGSVVMAGAVINCCTKIGENCIVNTGSTIDHDNFIEDYVHISPGAHLAGSVRVGKGTWVGIGGIVSNDISITNSCIIGAGSVVVKDISIPGTYIGVPARRS